LPTIRRYIMKHVRMIKPFLSILALIVAILACELPGNGNNADADVTQTMEALATTVASTLQSTDVEVPSPQAVGTELEAETTPLPEEIPTHTPVVPTPTDTSSLGKIVGLVWQDYNENGMVDSGEPAMPGAAILLGEGACVTAGFMGTATADDGSFVFEDVPAGEYCVSVFLPHGCGGFTPTTKHPRTIIVTPGIDLGGLMFGFIENPC
jgi:hypothetical protein